MKSLTNPHIFEIYYRRENQKFFLDNIDANIQKFFIFVLLEEAHEVKSDEDFVFSVLDYIFKLTIEKE